MESVFQLGAAKSNERMGADQSNEIKFCGPFCKGLSLLRPLRFNRINDFRVVNDGGVFDTHTLPPQKPAKSLVFYFYAVEARPFRHSTESHRSF
jgi:hypothetical protein